MTNHHSKNTPHEKVLVGSLDVPQSNNLLWKRTDGWADWAPMETEVSPPSSCRRKFYTWTGIPFAHRTGIPFAHSYGSGLVQRHKQRYTMLAFYKSINGNLSYYWNTIFFILYEFLKVSYSHLCELYSFHLALSILWLICPTYRQYNNH